MTAKEDWEVQRDHVREARRTAHERANTLLEQLLTADQRYSWEKYGWFNLRSQFGNIYRIYKYIDIYGLHTYNVALCDTEGKVLRSGRGFYCIVPEFMKLTCDGRLNELPAEDHYVAQYILLTANELRLLSTANSVSYDEWYRSWKNKLLTFNWKLW